MKVKELRIGNWVLWNGPIEKEEALVAMIAREEVSFECGDSGLITELEPIPITGERLLKLGFEFVFPPMGAIWSVYKRNGISIRDPYNKWEVVLGCQHCGHRNIKVDYIHQIQNLYFALTGLEIK